MRGYLQAVRSASQKVFKGRRVTKKGMKTDISLFQKLCLEMKDKNAVKSALKGGFIKNVYHPNPKGSEVIKFIQHV